MRLKLDMRSLSSKPNYVTDLFCHLMQFPHSLRDCFVPPVLFHSWVHCSILVFIYYLHCNQASSRETWFGVALLCQFLAAVLDILFEFYLMFYIYVKHAPKTAKTTEEALQVKQCFLYSTADHKAFLYSLTRSHKVGSAKNGAIVSWTLTPRLVASSLALCNEKPYSRWCHVSDVFRQWSLMNIISIKEQSPNRIPGLSSCLLNVFKELHCCEFFL